MGKPIRYVLAGLFCVARGRWRCDLADKPRIGGVEEDRPNSARHHGDRRFARGRTRARAAESPNRAGAFDVIPERFEDGGYATAFRSMAPIRDRGSLQELREAVRGRGRRGIATLARAVRPASARLPADYGPDHRRSFRSNSRSASFTRTKANSSKPPPGSRRRWRRPGLERRGRDPQSAKGDAGDHRPAAGRGRELPRMRRPVELHLPDRPRGRPSEPGRLARGGEVVHRVPRGVAAATCGSSGC